MAPHSAKVGLAIPAWFWLNTFKQGTPIIRFTADSLSLVLCNHSPAIFQNKWRQALDQQHWWYVYMLHILNPSCNQATSLFPSGWKFFRDISILCICSLSRASAIMQPQSLSTGREVTFEQFVGTVTQSNFWLFLAKLNFKGTYLIRKFHMLV